MASTSPRQVHELSLNQLLGRSMPILSASGVSAAPGLGAYSGNHEDQGVPNTLAGGESEMEKWLRESQGEVSVWDDVSGRELDADKVWEARKLEIELFKNMGVYRKVRRSWVKSQGEKVIGVRWIDINKGDSEHPDYRSRLVAKDFKGDNRPDLFAATPPLEALKLLISIVASNPGLHIMINDVKRAYFHAAVKRLVYIELPNEDRLEGDEDMVGELRLSMYGTRDAAQNWQETLSCHLLSIGFSRGKMNPAHSTMRAGTCAP